MDAEGVVVIPETIDGRSVNRIAASAFSFCRTITAVNIPSAVLTIGENAFYYCEDLVAINVDSGNPNFSSVDGVLFNQSKTDLLLFPKGRGGQYVIPTTTTRLGANSFENCRLLEHVLIPEGVTEIGANAFEYCFNMRSITIPSSLQTIGSDAFRVVETAVFIILGDLPYAFHDAFYVVDPFDRNYYGYKAYYFEGNSGFPSHSHIYEIEYVKLDSSYTDFFGDTFSIGSTTMHLGLPDSDFDGDGKSNYFEYIFGLDPSLKTESRPAISSEIIDPTGDTIQIKFHLRRGFPFPDTRLFLVTSSDLNDTSGELLSGYRWFGSELNRSEYSFSETEFSDGGAVNEIGQGIIEVVENIKISSNSAFFWVRLDRR